MPQPVMHFEIIANDTANLRRFYTALFAWRPEDFPEMGYSMLHTTEKEGINGGLGAASPALPAGLAVYVQVDDVERYLAEARRLGATQVLQEPYDVPGFGRFAVFCDPEGNRIGLWALPGPRTA